MCSVKTLEYQEHVGEYGVHWNFFLTVAAVSTVMALVPIPKSRSIAAGQHDLRRGLQAFNLHQISPVMALYPQEPANGCTLLYHITQCCIHNDSNTEHSPHLIVPKLG